MAAEDRPSPIGSLPNFESPASRGHRMDLLQRAGDLKPMLVDFAMSPRFEDELAAMVEQQYSDRLIDESLSSIVIDSFVLQHRLSSGRTVVEEFVAEHPELTAAERDMLLGWRDVVNGPFEIVGKQRDAIVLLSLIDDLTYRTRSNLGRGPFWRLKKGMFLFGRLVRTGDDWMISGNPIAFPASSRENMLVIAAEMTLEYPKAAFRNPVKLAEARRTTARQREAFVGLFGTDLIVVPGIDLPDKVDMFYRELSRRARPDDAEPPEPPPMEYPDDLLDADTAAIHFVEGEGLSFYANYHLLDELFSNPALISRRRYRESLADCLSAPRISPELLRRMAGRDPGKTNAVFAKFLRRKFSWDTDGEALLREHKPDYFDGPPVPGTVQLSSALSDALRRARQNTHPGRLSETGGPR